MAGALSEIRMPAWNAALRFVLELVALAGCGMGGHVVGGGAASWLRWPGAVIAVAVAATVWGRYRVPDDPGPAPVAVPGRIRLTIEAVTFAVGTIGLWAGSGAAWAIGFIVMVAFHYAMAPERWRWLLAQG